MQIAGNYLLVGVENSDHNNAHLRLYDLSDLLLDNKNMTLRGNFDLHVTRGAEAVGITTCIALDEREYYGSCCG